MVEDENKITDTEEKETVFNDEAFPYEVEPVYNENMEKAKNIEIAKNTYVYTNAEESFKENMSTAWSFLAIGIIGAIFTILNLTGTLHIMQGFLQKGVALVLFLGFMIYGILVIRSKKELLAKVDKEKADREKLTKWMKERFTDEVLSGLGTIDASPEELELLQINYMSEELVRHFPEINPNFADRLAEDFFEEKG